MVKKTISLPSYDPFYCDAGIRIMKCHEMASRSTFPVGCGVHQLSAQHLHSLRTLTKIILNQLGNGNLVSWGEGLSEDKKVRGYAMLQGGISKWQSMQQIVDHGILMHHEEAQYEEDPIALDEAKLKHDFTVNNSFTTVLLSEDQLDAIHAMIAATNEIISKYLDTNEIKQYERDCVQLSELVVIQPNVHNGDPLLPLHLDQPRYDGFGIVIVTVAIEGSGDVVIDDEGDDASCTLQSWTFPLCPGEMYVLCGPSRNLCTHGVMLTSKEENLIKPHGTGGKDQLSGKKRKKIELHCQNQFEDRISLNFRFGIHTQEQADDDINSKWH